MFELINTVILNFFQRLTDFLPNFFTGLGILIIGVILSTLLKNTLKSIFSFTRLDSVLEKMRLMRKNEVRIWEDILAEILRWVVVILFLIPTLEIWNLSRATAVINQLLFYLPNVIVAVVIGFVGLISANLGYDLIRSSFRSIGSASANTLSIFTKGIIIFFTILIVLNQLGVAQDLVRILFTGIVVMIALAGGLAFGLGGKEMAKDILEELRKKLK